MNNKLLNNMIMYIEEHLTEKIEYKVLAKIVGVSEYSLQRIFVFITGISLSDYIKKRRLSKAFEDIRNTDEKIIDIALKYQYNSSISFSRAFKKYFYMTPSECKSNNKKCKLLPIFEFKDSSNYESIKYEIKKIEEIKLYCLSVSSTSHEDLLFKIRQLYKKIRRNGLRIIFDEYGMYGISTYENNKFNYYVGSVKKIKSAKEIVIESGTYVVFEVGNENQEDITKTYDFVYSNWLISTSYEILDKPEIEYYENGKCSLCFMISDKQK